MFRVLPFGTFLITAGRIHPSLGLTTIPTLVALILFPTDGKRKKERKAAWEMRSCVTSRDSAWNLDHLEIHVCWMAQCCIQVKAAIDGKESFPSQ